MRSHRLRWWLHLQLKFLRRSGSLRWYCNNQLLERARSGTMKKIWEHKCLSVKSHNCQVKAKKKSQFWIIAQQMTKDITDWIYHINSSFQHSKMTESEHFSFFSFHIVAVWCNVFENLPTKASIHFRYGRFHERSNAVCLGQSTWNERSTIERLVSLLHLRKGMGRCVIVIGFVFFLRHLVLCVVSLHCELLTQCDAGDALIHCFDLPNIRCLCLLKLRSIDGHFHGLVEQRSCEQRCERDGVWTARHCSKNGMRSWTACKCYSKRKALTVCRIQQRNVKWYSTVCWVLGVPNWVKKKLRESLKLVSKSSNLSLEWMVFETIVWGEQGVDFFSFCLLLAGFS